MQFPAFYKTDFQGTLAGEDDSISQTSHTSGTFNKINNSLKMNQRKLNKQSNSGTSQASLASLNVFEEYTPTSKDIGKPTKRPPPLMVQAKTSTMPIDMLKQKLSIKSGPPQMVQITKQKTVVYEVAPSTKLPSPIKRDLAISLIKKQTVQPKESSHTDSLHTSQSLILENENESEPRMPKVENEDNFIIKVNLHIMSNINANVVLPSPNYSLLEQAKYIMNLSMKQVGDQVFTEEQLNQSIQKIYYSLMAKKQDEFQKTINESREKIQNLQSQLQQQTQGGRGINQQSSMRQSKGYKEEQVMNLVAQTSSTSQMNDSHFQDQSEEVKKLREECQELQTKIMFQDQDLVFQSLKTKDIQAKFENEIENMRSQLKGSQSEQFVKQQVEHKKLIEDNAMLIKEVKVLQEDLRDERQRVTDLFIDAEAVKNEILIEMNDFERTKLELEKVKQINQHLKRKRNDESIDLSNFDDTSMMGKDEETNYAGGKSKKNKKQVDVGISRPDSLISLSNQFNLKLEGMIDKKTNSIAQNVVKAHIHQFNDQFQPHPYANQLRGAFLSSSQASLINSDSNMYKQPPGQRMNQNVIEMSLYESEGGGIHSSQDLLTLQMNADRQRAISSTSQPPHQKSITDLNTLKSKIIELRDKHNSQVQDSMIKANSQASINQSHNLFNNNFQSVSHSANITESMVNSSLKKQNYHIFENSSPIRVGQVSKHSGSNHQLKDKQMQNMIADEMRQEEEQEGLSEDGDSSYDDEEEEEGEGEDDEEMEEQEEEESQVAENENSLIESQLVNLFHQQRNVNSSLNDIQRQNNGTGSWGGRGSQPQFGQNTNPDAYTETHNYHSLGIQPSAYNNNEHLGALDKEKNEMTGSVEFVEERNSPQKQEVYKVREKKSGAQGGFKGVQKLR